MKYENAKECNIDKMKCDKITYYKLKYFVNIKLNIFKPEYVHKVRLWYIKFLNVYRCTTLSTYIGIVILDTKLI